jgi:hypothetical protein
MGNEEIKRQQKIGILITPKKKKREELVTSRLYRCFFAWSYEDMSGLDTDIIVQRVLLVKGCKSVKEKLRRIHSDVLIKVKVEIEKQWNTDFLEVVKYPQRVSNIVVVQKKEDKIRVCLPHIDMFNKCSTYLQGRRISEFGIRV